MGLAHVGPYGLPGDGPIDRFERREALGYLPHGYIAGLILSNDGTDATNDIAISAGVCRSTCSIVEGEASTRIDDQRGIKIPVSIIKQLDVSWAPENYDPAGYSGGGRSGMRDPLAAISNTTWHIYAVGGGGLQDDIMAIASATQATVLASVSAAGFTAYRRIGSIIRSGGSILAFSQLGDEFLLSTPVLDQAAALGGTGSATVTLSSVPNGIQVWGLFNLALSATDRLYLNAIGLTDIAPSTTVAPLATSSNSAGFNGSGPHRIRTSTTRQIYARISANNTIYVATLGWIDNRDRDA